MACVHPNDYDGYHQIQVDCGCETDPGCYNDGLGWVGMGTTGSCWKLTCPDGTSVCATAGATSDDAACADHQGWAVVLALAGVAVVLALAGVFGYAFKKKVWCFDRAAARRREKRKLNRGTSVHQARVQRQADALFNYDATALHQKAQADGCDPAEIQKAMLTGENQKDALIDLILREKKAEADEADKQAAEASAVLPVVVSSSEVGRSNQKGSSESYPHMEYNEKGKPLIMKKLDELVKAKKIKIAYDKAGTSTASAKDGKAIERALKLRNPEDPEDTEWKEMIKETGWWKTFTDSLKQTIKMEAQGADGETLTVVCIEGVRY